MAAKKTKKPKQLKATWERGYNGHSLWQGKNRIGKVTVHASMDATHKYTWQAAKRRGAADTLERAGTYLQQQDLNDMRADLENIIRRYPVQSLLIGLGVGYLLARGTRR